MRATMDVHRAVTGGGRRTAALVAAAAAILASSPHGATAREAASGREPEIAARAGAEAGVRWEPGGATEEMARRAPGDSAVTVLEAVRRALEHHPDVAASRASLEGARAGLREAGAARWPDLRLTGSATRYQEPMVVGPIHAFTPGQTPPFDETLFQGGLHAGYTLFDGGGRSAQIRRARAEASAADAGFDGSRQLLTAEVAGSYLEVLTRERVLDAHRRRIAALEEELDRARQLHDVGRAARVEVLRAEASLAGARADGTSAGIGLDVARRDLARMMGASPDEVTSRGLTPLASVRGAAPGRDAALADALAAHPAVERARREEAAGSAAVDVARAARWPRLEAGAGWVERASADGHYSLEWSAGLQVSMPLFTGGRVGAGVDVARAAEDRAGARRREAELAVEEAVDRALSALREAAARVESLATAVEASAEVARIEKLRLETGAGAQTDYLDAEARLLEARARLVEARHAELRARVELARATGRLTPRWIGANLEASR